MNSKKKISRAQYMAIAASMTVALAGTGVAVAQNVNLPNQNAIAADTKCEDVDKTSAPVAFSTAKGGQWVREDLEFWEGNGLAPGGQVHRSFAIRNLDSRDLRVTIDLSESQITDKGYFAIGAAIGSVTPNAENADPATITYPGAPAVPQSEQAANGFKWLIGDNVPTALTADQRGDNIAEVIIPSGHYVTVTDWVAVPRDFTLTSPNQKIDPSWSLTAEPGTLENGVFTPAPDNAPNFIPIGCEQQSENTEDPDNAEQHGPKPVGSPETVTVGDTVDPKDYIQDADKLPAGTTFEFKDPKPNFDEPGDVDTTIVVTYPDGTTDEVTVTIPVKAAPTQSDADKNDPTPVTTPAEVTPGTTPNPKDYVKDAAKLPAGTTFEFKDPKPNFNEPGDKKTTIVVTYPDGTTDEITVTIPVKAATPAQTDADKNDPTPVTTPAEVTAGTTPNPKDYVKDAAKLPAGTTFEFKDPKPNFTEPGNVNTTIVITYPDGTTDEVTVTIPVKAAPTQSDADKNEPKAVSSAEVTVGDTVDPKNFIANADKLPAGTKFAFADPQPDFSKSGVKNTVVMVAYPDGSTDVVKVNIRVKDATVTPAPGGSSWKDLSARCQKAIIGGSISGVLGLIIAVASQVRIPGLDDQLAAVNIQIQKSLGVFNPNLAAKAENMTGILGGLLGTTIFLSSLGTTVGICKAETGKGSSDK